MVLDEQEGQGGPGLERIGQSPRIRRVKARGTASWRPYRRIASRNGNDCRQERAEIALFNDTAETRLTLRGVTHGAMADDTPLVSIWFRFDWRLSSGRRAPFDVVDVLELATDGRTAVLRIV